MLNKEFVVSLHDGNGNQYAGFGNSLSFESGQRITHARPSI